jgi:acid phosphatase family membrane protein YuiD
LREVLGHTPLEVTGGVLFGIVVATLMWLLWPM